MSRKTRTYTLGEIVKRLGGELVGDPRMRVSQVATLESARPEDLAFAAHGKYLKQLANTAAGAVIVGRAARGATDLPRIVCDDPYAYFARVSAFLNPRPRARSGVHPAARVARSARVGGGASVGAFAVIEDNVRLAPNCSIGAGCYLGANVSVGAGSELYPNVVVYHDCVIGERAVLHAGVVIGADGFGIAMHEGRWLKIPQIGRVVIGNDVEIGANTTVDRGALDDTVIEDGVKLDNQIQVGHNVCIGAHTAIAGCAGIAGSARIGRYCRIGGGAIILGHLTIADHVEISAATLITKSIGTPGKYTSAYPFEAHRNWLKNAAHLRKLDELVRAVRKLGRGARQRGGKKS